ncbi:hypothetical protein K438DRAFT_513136 [Mycena galopus ATCC 62051]|nr:hypothetical protein K438DRAFT_513136 [Mycena galopus ATCC 62051]
MTMSHTTPWVLSFDLSPHPPHGIHFHSFDMLTLFAILASFYIPSALAQSIVVTDPVGVVQCTTYTITWTGGVPPFEVQVVGPGGDNYGTFTSVVGQSTQWVVNNLGNPPAPSPMPFFIVVTDSTGAEGTSESESIAAGNISLSSGGICASIQGCVLLFRFRPVVVGSCILSFIDDGIIDESVVPLLAPTE